MLGTEGEKLEKKFESGNSADLGRGVEHRRDVRVEMAGLQSTSVRRGSMSAHGPDIPGPGLNVVMPVIKSNPYMVSKDTAERMFDSIGTAMAEHLDRAKDIKKEIDNMPLLSEIRPSPFLPAPTVENV